MLNGRDIQLIKNFIRECEKLSHSFLSGDDDFNNIVDLAETYLGYNVYGDYKFIDILKKVVGVK